MDWSNSIKQLREKMQLSQEELAKELGVSFASVNRYENGRFEPTIKVKRKIKTLLVEYNVMNNYNKDISLMISKEECELLRDLLKTEILETENSIEIENDLGSKKELEDYLKHIKNIFVELTKKYNL